VGQIILLGATGRRRLNGAVKSPTELTDILAAYPEWLLVLGGTLVLAVAIWLFMKVVKWLLYLLLALVLIGGIGWAVWLLLQPVAGAAG